MNKKLQLLWVFLLGVIIAMVYNYFYNMNGRYIPIRTKYSDINLSILDTKTGAIYVEGRYNDKYFYKKIDLITESLKQAKK
ncbi:hypothetical protein [Chryseobacterium sp. RR2-3-20]|uniref:hypothetical protein n=1 Tax=Chryseobacterium sp. RR2-3-20 TaxID=2787626 RepID=UPI001ADF1601|nr:hypothetical protein [Chryseobacterium sp. RR2-3-20]